MVAMAEQSAVPLPAPLPVALEELPVSPPLAPRTHTMISTPTNIFGLSRHYFSNEFPRHDPDSDLTPEDLSDIPSTPDLPSSIENDIFPYPNLNAYLLGAWYWEQGSKSLHDFKRLIEIVGDEAFRPADVRAVDWKRIDSSLASDDVASTPDVASWSTAHVSILVPFHHRRSPGSLTAAPNRVPEPRSYTLPEQFRFRRLVDVIREKLMNPKDFAHFHLEPFELRWDCQAGGSERVHSELYMSDAFIEAHQEVQSAPPVSGCTRPRVVVALMLWSDATHLTSFGEAELHPIYLFFGNESKYRRNRPSAHLANHIAYLINVCRRFLLKPFALYFRFWIATRQFQHICEVPNNR
jgi:hypothetical protein